MRSPGWGSGLPAGLGRGGQQQERRQQERRQEGGEDRGGTGTHGRGSGTGDLTGFTGGYARAPPRFRGAAGRALPGIPEAPKTL